MWTSRAWATRWLTVAGVAAALVLALTLTLPRVALAAVPEPPQYPARPVPAAPAAPAPSASATGETINLCDVVSKLSTYGPVTQKALEPSEGVTQISIGGGKIVLDGFKVASQLGWGLQVGEDFVLLFCNDEPPASSLCLLFDLIHGAAGTVALFDAAPGVTQLALEGGAIVLEGAELATPVGWALLIGGIVLDVACDGSQPPPPSSGPPVDPSTIPPSLVSATLPPGAVSVTICYPEFGVCESANGASPPSLISAPLPAGAVSATVCYPDFGVCESVNGSTSPSTPDPNPPTTDPTPVVTSSVCDSEDQNCVPADPGSPPATDPGQPTTDPGSPPATDPEPPTTDPTGDGGDDGGGGGGDGGDDGSGGPPEMDVD